MAFAAALLVSFALSVWVPFSKTYDTLWSNRALADREINAIAAQHVGAVFLTMSAADLKRLSQPGDPFTGTVRDVLMRLAADGIAGCAAILSDTFTGSPKQMAKSALVDALLDFNGAAASPSARFACVSTDLEMPAGNRTVGTYDRWKAFHADLRRRVASRHADLAVVAWMQGPDYLISHLPPADRQTLMSREHITQDPADTAMYAGALRYFMTSDAGPVVDAVIPMWYFTPVESYERHVDHTVREWQTLHLPSLRLVPGIMVQNQRHGLCCPGCVAGRADYDGRLAYNARTAGVSGTAVFLWPIPRQWTCPAS
jgi:hypothetical protein